MEELGNRAVACSMGHIVLAASEGHVVLPASHESSAARSVHQ